MKSERQWPSDGATWLLSKRVLVTGGGGFLGTHVVRGLRRLGCRKIFVPRRASYDLTCMDDVVRMYQHARPEVVIHLAAQVSGINYIRQRPGQFFYRNLMMGVQTMEQARRHGVEKFVAITTVCAYPRDAHLPFHEDELWSGYPEETNAPYGIAKKMLIVQAKAYREEYGFNAICLVPANLYGPGDNFDPESSHVIPALIRRCVEAKEKGLHELETWGTGQASREFLYVVDCAEAVLAATLHYEGSDPVNIGSGREIRIRDLAEMIAEITDFRGRIVWDHSKPEGQHRRCLDVTKAEQLFGFSARTPLEEGLRQTVAWFFRQANPGRVAASNAEGS